MILDVIKANKQNTYTFYFCIIEHIYIIFLSSDVKFTSIYPTMHCCETVHFWFINSFLSLNMNIDCSATCKDWLPWGRWSYTAMKNPSALRVHDESFKVRVQIRHEGVDKVLDGGSFLQHAWTWNKRGKFQLHTLSQALAGWFSCVNDLFR